MKVEVEVRVSDIMDAMDLSEPPEDWDPSEKVDLTVDVDEDPIIDQAVNDQNLVSAEDTALNCILDQGTVMDLAAAIRRGDRTEAELMLDRLMADDQTVSDWVQLGRFSRKARPRVEGLRRAA